MVMSPAYPVSHPGPWTNLAPPAGPLKTIALPHHTDLKALEAKPKFGLCLEYVSKIRRSSSADCDALCACMPQAILNDNLPNRSDLIQHVLAGLHRIRNPSRLQIIPSLAAMPSSTIHANPWCGICETSTRASQSISCAPKCLNYETSRLRSKSAQTDATVSSFHHEVYSECSLSADWTSPSQKSRPAMYLRPLSYTQFFC